MAIYSGGENLFTRFRSAVFSGLSVCHGLIPCPLSSSKRAGRVSSLVPPANQTGGWLRVSNCYSAVSGRDTLRWPSLAIPRGRSKKARVSSDFVNSWRKSWQAVPFLNLGIGAAKKPVVAVATGNASERKCHNNNPPVAVFTPHNQERKKQMKTMKNVRKAGFTLVEIMIVVAIIGLLAAIAIPNFVKARATSQANACINNLRQIDAAANQFALEQKKKTNDPISYPTDLSPYIKLNSANSIPGCPAGGSYVEATVGVSPTCSLAATVTPSHILP
jgi:prepilin-type N-terminal cleavage/methylation domain-containing protein